MIPGPVLKQLRHAHGLLERGDARGALKDLEEATRRAPKVFEGWFLLGQARGMLGDHAAASRAFSEATRCRPEHGEAWFNLGLSHALKGRHDEALPCFRTAMERARPSFHFPAAYNRAASALRLDRFDEAARVIWDALHVQETAELWSMLGVALQGANDYPGALEAYEKAHAMGVDDYTLHLNLGTCHYTLHDYAQGARSARQALDRQPGDPVATFNLASCQLALGRVEEAITLLTPLSMPLADHTRLYALNFLDPYQPDRLLREHRAWGDREIARVPVQAPLQPRNGDRPLRLGFVSADLREHPVAYFLRPLLEGLDRQAYSIVIYNDVRSEDAMTARLRGLGDDWRDIHGWSHDRVAEAIQADDLDLLFDLGGHTSERVVLFARRLAPVQAAYLGYGATSGLASMDYFLTDECLDPPGMTEGHYVERLLRLGACCAAYAPPEEAPPVSPLPMVSRGFPVLASFNRINKLSPTTLALWGAALKAVPTARLLLVTRGLEAAETRQTLLSALDRHGVTPERVEMRGNLTMQEYLALHGAVDLLLDCFPWNGHTTTMHALWMGVPTLTMAGTHHAGRFGQMVMEGVGLGDFVAPDANAFPERVRSILADPERLEALRAGMRARLRGSRLMDQQGLVQRFQEACRSMGSGGWGEK